MRAERDAAERQDHEQRGQRAVHVVEERPVVGCGIETRRTARGPGSQRLRAAGKRPKSLRSRDAGQVLDSDAAPGADASASSVAAARLPRHQYEMGKGIAAGASREKTARRANASGAARPRALKAAKQVAMRLLREVRCVLDDRNGAAGVKAIEVLAHGLHREYPVLEARIGAIHRGIGLHQRQAHEVIASGRAAHEAARLGLVGLDLGPVEDAARESRERARHREHRAVDLDGLDLPRTRLQREGYVETAARAEDENTGRMQGAKRQTLEPRQLFERGVGEALAEAVPARDPRGVHPVGEEIAHPGFIRCDEVGAAEGVVARFEDASALVLRLRDHVRPETPRRPGIHSSVGKARLPAKARAPEQRQAEPLARGGCH